MSDAVLKPQLIIRQFDSLTSYADRFVEMKALTEQRDADTPDELWILQHHDVLTQGQAGKPEHILMSSNIPVVQTDRGGQVTWHGPGQLVAYFMFDLNRLGWNVRTLVSYAENLMIELLKKYEIEAYAKPDAPGVYVDGRKIGSLGFKIRKGRSYHGLSLNIDCDLFGFHTLIHAAMRAKKWCVSQTSNQTTRFLKTYVLTLLKLYSTAVTLKKFKYSIYKGFAFHGKIN